MGIVNRRPADSTPPTTSLTDDLLQHLLPTKTVPKASASVHFGITRGPSTDTTDLCIFVLHKQRSVNPVKLRSIIHANGNGLTDKGLMDLKDFLGWVEEGRLNGALPTWSRVHLF